MSNIYKKYLIFFLLTMPVRLLQFRARMLSGDVIKRWVSFVNQTYSHHTHKAYKSVIWRFYDYAPKYICDTTLEDVQRYLASLSGLCNTTVNSHIIALKSFGHWCQDRQLGNPFKKLKKLPECPKQRVLSKEEYDKILAVSISINHEADPLIFLGNSGLRASELLSLNSSAISSDHKFLYVVGKGHSRVVPLNDTCRQIINRHPDLQLTKSYVCLLRLCKCLAVRAGIPQFTPHSLRHFFATQLMRKGISIYRISKVLGHSSVTVTEKIYLHFQAQIDLRGITDVLDQQE